MTSELRRRGASSSSSSADACSCGFVFPDEAAFCMKCGSKRGSQAASSASGSAPPSSSTVATTATSAASSGAAGSNTDGKKPNDLANATEEEKAQLIDELAQMLTSMKKAPVPGLKNTTKKIKDQLTEEPYNMNLIHELGMAYIEEEKWDQCVNVMMRGFKRVKEFKDLSVRYEFLYSLCKASLNCNKFRQALAVLNDMEEPVDKEQRTDMEVLKCEVCCANGDMERGLKAFHNAIEGEGFETASQVWLMCLPSLKKVKCFEITKSAVEALATNDDERSRLEAVTKLSELRDEFKKSEEGDKSALRKYILICVGSVAVIVLTYVLYLLEARSLEKMNLSSK